MAPEDGGNHISSHFLTDTVTGLLHVLGEEPKTTAVNLRDEVPGAVTEQRQHGQELLGLFGVIVEALREEL